MKERLVRIPGHVLLPTRTRATADAISGGELYGNLVQVDTDLGGELGDELGTRASLIPRDERRAEIDERVLLDQVDDPSRHEETF